MTIFATKPVQWCCTQCDWRHSAIQKSDCLTPHPKQCPKCGSKNFEMKDASLLDNALDKVGSLFRS